MYKQNFKSPILKALVGKQKNLPQHLQDAIKAAPESPAKMKDLSGDGKITKKDVLIGRGVLDKDGSPAKQVSKPKKKMRRVKGPKEAEALETRKRTGHNPMPKRSPAKKNDPTGREKTIKKRKKASEAEIDRRYASTVGTNPRTGDLNYPISVDMDKLSATAGSAGNPDKLRKAISDQYYAQRRNKKGGIPMPRKSGMPSPAKNYKKGYYGK